MNNILPDGFFSGFLCCVLWSSGWFKQHWVLGINRLHFRCLQAEDKVGFWSSWRCHVSLQNHLNPDNDYLIASSITLSRDVLNPGRELVASGYALYGSATVMILTTGDGVQGWAKSNNKCTGVLASLQQFYRISSSLIDRKFIDKTPQKIIA